MALPSGLAELCVGAAANQFLQPGGNHNTGLMRSLLASWDERRSPLQGYGGIFILV